MMATLVQLVLFESIISGSGKSTSSDRISISLFRLCEQRKREPDKGFKALCHNAGEPKK
jgi:hypothetical protein